VRAVITIVGLDPVARSLADAAESPAACPDLQADAHAPDVDRHGAEFESLAAQTLTGGLLA
jgi:hypothetical protein